MVYGGAAAGGCEGVRRGEVTKEKVRALPHFFPPRVLPLPTCISVSPNITSFPCSWSVCSSRPSLRFRLLPWQQQWYVLECHYIINAILHFCLWLG